MLSFYDWYADLPVASPQVFGDQTDVPESGDWWNAGYLIMWGSNLPVTRTPDAHWMTEARYRGQKVIAVAPDYADNVKFADEWLPAKPGTDAALAMAMGHVVLKEFFVDRQTPYFTEYVKTYTDLPHLVRLEERGRRCVHRRQVPAPPPTSPDARGASENAAFKTVLIDAGPASPSSRTAPWAIGTARRGWASGTSSSATSTRPSPCSTPRPSRSSSGCRASTPPTAPRPTCRAGSRASRRRAPGHHGLRPAPGAVRRGPRRAAGHVADGVRRRGVAVHPGVAGGDHRCAGRHGRTDRARVRPERRGVPGPLDDRDGCRHQPLVPLRHDLPRLPHPHQPDRLPGRQRRRVGPLRGPGEGPPDHRLHPDRERASTGTGRRAT